MDKKSGEQTLLFCPASQCRVITFVPMTTGGGAHVPMCPSCQTIGVRVRGPVSETNFRDRLAAIALPRPDPETATSPVVGASETSEGDAGEGS